MGQSVRRVLEIDRYNKNDNIHKSEDQKNQRAKRILTNIDHQKQNIYKKNHMFKMDILTF